jgi:hypothetical protein
MSDIQTQLPVKLTDNTNTAGITASSALKVDVSATGANSTAIKVDGSAVTQPVSGTVTANAGTNLNTSALALDTSVNGVLLAQASTTSGQTGPLVQGAVTTAAPSYTTGKTDPLSLTTAGALRVDGSAVTQPVSGTITANAGTGNFAVNVAQIAGSTTSTAATGIQKVGISDSSGSSITLGQTTMASSVPVVIASNQSAVSVTFGVTSTGIVASYNTSSAIADGATGTLTYTVTSGKTLYLKQFIAGSSGGPCKVVVDYGAGPTVICVVFYSTTQPFVTIAFEQPISITASTAVNIKITNHAGASQDVYGTLIGVEV